jgi:hypothetical protein
MSALAPAHSSYDATAIAIANAPEILSSILQKELVTNSCNEYLDPADPSMITAADRMALVDWCYHVVDNCQYPRELVAMTMVMVDAFLSMPSSTADAARASDEALHSQNKFQLLTIAALYCSIKTKSDVVIPNDQFAHSICDGLYTKEEIETMERTLLSGSSSWQFAPVVTAYEVGRTILSVLLSYTNLPETTWGFLLDEVQYQTEHAVRDYYFSTQRTSTIALAAILNTVKCLRSKTHQDMLSIALKHVVDHFDFDDSNVIFVACQRLQSLVDGKLAHPPLSDLSLDDSLKSLDDFSAGGGDEDSINDVDFNDFLNTFVPECDRRMPVMPTKHVADAPAAFAASRPADETKLWPTVSTTHQAPPPLPLTTSTRAAIEANIPMKPMRPPTAYHIYLQIEKEFIVQTMDGEEADKSMHDNKVYLDYVPERYRQIKLSPDWYFGPGKRKTKRKHRKGHGKIGFKELISIIASRWSKLEETNPDVKRFVKKIADQELAEYRQDMMVYQRYIKENGLSELASSPTKSKKMMKRKQQESEQPKPRKKSSNTSSFRRTVSSEGAVEASSSATSRRVSDKEEDPPRIISPSTSERQSSQVIVSTDLTGFSYLPARKRS